MAISIAEIRSWGMSKDRSEVIVSGKGRYVGDIEIAVSTHCLGGLIDALTSARNSLEPAPGPAEVPAAQAQSVASANPQELRVEFPKSCRVMVDPSGRGLVLMLFDQNLESRRGYAVPPDAAQKMAQGLIRTADAISATRSASPQPAPEGA